MSIDTTGQTTKIPYLDTFAPDFRPDGPEARAAAEINWYAQTPIGPAVLRYEECAALLRNRKLHGGFTAGLMYWGVSAGPFFEWARTSLLALEGEPHDRLRRLVSHAFTPRSVERLQPFMRAKATELLDGSPPPDVASSCPPSPTPTRHG